jgi:hypothetical protein
MASMLRLLSPCKGARELVSPLVYGRAKTPIVKIDVIVASMVVVNCILDDRDQRLGTKAEMQTEIMMRFCIVEM